MRRSPIEPDLAARGARWTMVGHARVATHLDGDDVTADLSLCDLSPLGILGIKGPGSAAWLDTHGLAVPDAIYDTTTFSDQGILGRLGEQEFMVGGGHSPDRVDSLLHDLRTAPHDVFDVEREDASFQIAGHRGRDALAQTCGVDFGAQPMNRLVLTRLAGVSGTVLPFQFGDEPAWRMWIDPSYATYLWEQLTTIIVELNGRIVGAACGMPGLASETGP